MCYGFRCLLAESGEYMAVERTTVVQHTGVAFGAAGLVAVVGTSVDLGTAAGVVCAGRLVEKLDYAARQAAERTVAETVVAD